MKWIAVILVMVGVSISAYSQTFEGFQEMGNNYTCYYIDSNNVHCYAEDTEADLDLDNDGVLDREYIFSTPDPDKGIDKNDMEDKGVIQNRKPEIYYEEDSEDEMNDTGNIY